MFRHLSVENRPESANGTPAPCDCAADPIAGLKALFVDTVMGRRLKAGQEPALRPVFLKTHGVAFGTFEVQPDLPDELRVGLFEHREFPAVVRFSSDTTPRNPDFKTTLGIAIKLVGVPGCKLLIEDAVTCDFLLQNHDVFFVDAAQEMCEFTYAGVIGGSYDPYLAAHPTTKRILDDMEKMERSVLRSTYWGLLPHKFGAERFVKYKLAPAANSQKFDVDFAAESLPNYLYADLKTRLLREDATFHLYVQVRTDEVAMPLDRATVLWDEKASHPIHVATLTLARQNIDAGMQAEYGENLAFNIWQTLPEHEPQGSIAAARKVVYYAAAELRRSTNGVSTVEPIMPEPAPAAPTPHDTTIVRAEIHPAIGIARVGNSVNEYFIGPEVPHPEPAALGLYKDAKGALKRQAAKFRVYGYNKDGDVVAELTVDNAVIEWSAHVANKKAAWYNFTLAMDTPEVSNPKIEPARRRNSQLKGADRRQLVIDPGVRTIHGRNTHGSTYRFDTGMFMDQPVYLGELRTDEAGRLIFLGGRGESRSATGARPFDFANNDGWFDDVSDGPVSAQVWLNGREIPVESAWVVVAPPNYAPELKSVRTMYDLLEDLRFDPATDDVGEVSFSRDIEPILERMCGLQWVNLGFAESFGWKRPYEFVRPDYLERLSLDPAKAPTAANRTELAELRKEIFNSFRDYATNNGWRGLWPWIYGDAMDVDGAQHRDLALSNRQLQRLKKWSDGDFISDYDPKPKFKRKLEEYDLSERPSTLTEAALTFCVADAFHPGCEITWVVRNAFVYRPLPPNPKDTRRLALSRFKVRSATLPEADFGDVLVPQTALSSSGPLNSLGAGDLGRWMALPWQTDTASCRAGYEQFTPSTPTFWPARVPNHVLTAADYEIVMNSTDPAKRWEAFRRRPNWLRSLGNYFDSIFRMVTEFGNLGVVERRDGPADGEFPQVILVESALPPGPAPPAAAQAAAVVDMAVPTPSDKAVFEAPEANAVSEESFIPKVDRFRKKPSIGERARTSQ